MKKYTKHQILEAIKHWENVLKRMDESKSPLLDAFAEKFGEDVVFSYKPFSMTNKSINEIFSIFNNFIFDNQLNHISLQYLEYQNIYKIAKQIYDKYRQLNDDEYVPPPTTIYGMYFTVVINSNEIVKPNDSLIFSDEEIIFLNMTKLKNTSFALQAASLCHEMIHQYDIQHGEYQDRYKAFLITGEKMKSHETPTFENKMKHARDNYIDVIKFIPQNQLVSQSNNNSVEFALQALKESKDGLPCVVMDNTPEIQFVGNRKYVVIQEFD